MFRVHAWDYLATETVGSSDVGGRRLCLLVLWFREPSLVAELVSLYSMSTRAKATLAASCAISAFIIWGVHYQQTKERDVRVGSFLLRMHPLTTPRTCFKGYCAMTNAEEKRCGKDRKNLKNRNVNE